MSEHKKSKDALDTLGTILTQDEGRDAVHIAVVCCRVADGQNLVPGQQVTLYTPNGFQGTPTIGDPRRGDKVLGILDPLLSV